MIGRARELLAELVDVVRTARALPHLVEVGRELELRVLRLEDDRDRLELELGHLTTITRELYIGPTTSDAEVADA